MFYVFNICIAVIDTILCTGKGSVALRLLCFGINLCNLNDKLFEGVGEFSLCNLIPSDRCGLGLRNNVTNSSIHFFKGLVLIAAYKDILEVGYAVLVGGSVFVNICA